MGRAHGDISGSALEFGWLTEVNSTHLSSPVSMDVQSHYNNKVYNSKRQKSWTDKVWSIDLLSYSE